MGPRDAVSNLVYHASVVPGAEAPAPGVLPVRRGACQPHIASHTSDSRGCSPLPDFQASPAAMTILDFGLAIRAGATRLRVIFQVPSFPKHGDRHVLCVIASVWQIVASLVYGSGPCRVDGPLDCQIVGLTPLQK